MLETNTYNILIDHLDKIKSEISPSDFRFYNIGHFPLLIKKSIHFSVDCEVCKENIQKLEKISFSLPHSLINSFEERKNFEKNKNSIEDHLKRIHKQRFPGYYAALGSFLGIVLGIAPSIIYGIATDSQVVNTLFFVGFAIGLLIGRTLGILADKRIYIKNSQL